MTVRLLIIGPQGAGKGTQAALLCKKLGIPHVSTGDLFRENIGNGTELGERAQQYMNAGELVPDSVTQDMVTDRLAQPDAEPGFLLDGFPRNIGQASWLSDTLTADGAAIDTVILLTAPHDVLMQRMLARGRDDDTPDAIEKRLAIYHAETQPLVDYYRDTVAEIDGVGSVDEIHQRIVGAVHAEQQPAADTTRPASEAH